VEQHRERAGTFVRDRDVPAPVAVEIDDASRRRLDAGRVRGRRLECPRAGAREDGDRARVVRGGHDVRLAVAGDVADRGRGRLPHAGVGDPRRKRTVAVALEHGHGVGRQLRDDEIETPVAVEVAGGDGFRAPTDRDRPHRSERSDRSR